MANNYALPKFESAEKRRKRWMQWGLIGGVLVLVQLGVFVVVVLNRTERARQETARLATERARAALQAAEAAERARAEAERTARALAVTDVAELPPRAEEPAVAPGQDGKRGPRNAGSRAGRRRGKTAMKSAGAETSTTPAAPAKRQPDAIDALLKGFR